MWRVGKSDSSNLSPRRSIHIRGLPADATKQEVETWCRQVAYAQIRVPAVLEAPGPLIRRSWISRPICSPAAEDVSHLMAHVELCNEDIRDLVRASAHTLAFREGVELQVGLQRERSTGEDLLTVLR